MVYYGNGGFTFMDLYNMPVYLRNFILRKIIDIKNAENEKQQESSAAAKGKTITKL